MTSEFGSDLATLLEKYPLPSGEGKLEVLQELVRIHSVAIHIAGVATTVDGECVTGSAGSNLEPPLPRAYFELLERIAILNAIRCARVTVSTCDWTGQPGGDLPRETVFPDRPARPGCSWARSSGVAVGETWREATARARLELIERDRILRSWYGEHAPTRVSNGQDFVPAALRECYGFEAHSFGECRERDGDVVVVGMFGFPKNHEPFVYGFGARLNVRDATACAASECIQRLAFLWGEGMPEEPPLPSPTPDFHQEHYLYGKHLDRIRRWLRGEHRSYAGILNAASAVSEPLYVDVTPPSLSACLRIAKAVPAHHVPLSFGRGHPMLTGEPPEELAVHPIV